MDILFIHQFGQYLFQLASTSNHVQSLIAYMRETVAAIESEFKTMDNLAQRFVNLADEEVSKGGSDACLEFFEFLVTGAPSPDLKEFLSGTLTERVSLVAEWQFYCLYKSRDKSVGKRVGSLDMRTCAGSFTSRLFQQLNA